MNTAHWPRRWWFALATTTIVLLWALWAWRVQAHDLAPWACNSTRWSVYITVQDSAKWSTRGLAPGACTTSDETPVSLWGRWESPDGKWALRAWAIDRGGVWIRDANVSRSASPRWLRLRLASGARGHWVNTAWPWPTPEASVDYGLTQ